tara:strand:- start:64 stop:540 length:477 start_codon:yes stop_codon:yes gene_type:complete
MKTNKQELKRVVKEEIERAFLEATPDERAQLMLAEAPAPEDFVVMDGGWSQMHPLKKAALVGVGGVLNTLKNWRGELANAIRGSIPAVSAPTTTRKNACCNPNIRCRPVLSDDCFEDNEALQAGEMTREEYSEKWGDPEAERLMAMANVPEFNVSKKE